jgi:hypothetical protein
VGSQQKPPAPPSSPMPKSHHSQRACSHLQGEEASVPRKILPPPPEADLGDIEGYTYPQHLQDQGRITTDETKAAILRLKPLTAPGITGIPHLVIQKSVDVTLQTITDLFQACATLGYHPLELKKARTVALKKPGRDRDYTKVGAYRPIALLESLGKALERIMASRLSALAEAHSSSRWVPERKEIRSQP